MRVSPFLLSARRQLLAAFIVSLVIGVLGILLVSTHRPWDVGVLWHTASQRRVTQADSRVLFFLLFVTESVTAFVLAGSISPATAGLGANAAHARFLLSRPRSRSALFLAPLLLASAGLLCIPAATALLLIGWLASVHAPVLHHLIALAQLAPSSAGLPSSLHLGRQYLAGFAFGMCVVAIFHSSRWLIFSSNPTVRTCTTIGRSIFYLSPAMVISAKSTASALLLLPRGFGLPSILNIVLHLVFVVALCLFTRRFVQRIEVS